MRLFNLLLNKKKMVDQIQEYLAKDAIVLDVRTQEEWNTGHVNGAKHIVLTTIPLHIEEIKSWDKPIITVCKSGGRSYQAMQFLAKNGLDVINGGAWQNVNKYVN